MALAIAIPLASCGHDASAPDATTGGGDGAPMQVDDGTPTRQQCTSHFGDALTMDFGRLDGYLVAIVPPSNMQSCNDDASHVHLQISMNGAIYDIAVDATDEDTMVDDVHTTTKDMALPGGMPWTEGWHTDGILDDYQTDGITSADMPLLSETAIVSTVTTDLATVNHISIYATGYGTTGAHLVHRDGSGHDGLLVTEPLSTPAHARFFSFTSQTF